MKLLTESLAIGCGQSVPGGLLTVEYLPLPYLQSSSADSSVSLDNNFVGTLTSSYPENWFSVKLLIDDREWRDNLRPDEQGSFFERSIEGAYAADEVPTRRLLERMKQFRYLVRVTDRSGNRWLLNRPETAFGFSYTYQTSPRGSAARKYQFRWSGQEWREAVLWNNN